MLGVYCPYIAYLIYCIGEGEVGQLGLPTDQLTRNVDERPYLSTPKRIRSVLEHAVVTQVACGDGHSLALTQKGTVYGWGYNEQGQLSFDVQNESSYRVGEPTLIDKLGPMKVVEVHAEARSRCS